MKRIFVLLILMLALFSCAERYELLSYQEGDISAKCSLNDKYIINVEKSADERVLKILEPCELEGVEFRCTSEGCVAICDDIEIPIDRALLNGVVAICSIFDLDESAIQASIADEDEASVSFLMDDISYTVTYGDDCLPSLIEISTDGFSHILRVLEITK
ncbi:MAG: hypothetical protein J6A54_03605 [Clostridia bacterium]|nr:hypothetical protein [Clostridia bacterium]